MVKIFPQHLLHMRGQSVRAGFLCVRLRVVTQIFHFACGRGPSVKTHRWNRPP